MMEIEKLKDMLCNAAGGPVGIQMCQEAADALEHLQAENERLKAQVPRWIPVEERLPVVQGEYIVTACDEGCPYGEGIWYSTVVVVADYYKGCWTWDYYRCEYDISDIVTHWMPLPKLPKEASHD